MSRTVAVSTVVLFIAWVAAPAYAAGPLYAVPSNPPSDTKSVDFTNALNHRVRHLPTALNPPIAESPEQVGARLQTLERGVVIEGRPKQPEVHSVHGHDTPAMFVAAADPGGGRAPLSLAFVAAGGLALLGLLLSARGKYPGSTQQA
jgi:hypothetical protein